MCSSPIPKKPSAAPAFSIHLTNTLDALVELNEWIDEVAREGNLSQELQFKLNLILEETVTNTILHGFEEHQSGRIEILVYLEPHQAFLEVQDDGIPFNPLADHTVVLPTSLQDADVGGLGIHLMKNYADSISYERIDNINRLAFLLLINE